MEVLFVLTNIVVDGNHGDVFILVCILDRGKPREPSKRKPRAAQAFSVRIVGNVRNVCELYP